MKDFVNETVKDMLEQIAKDKPQYPSDYAHEWADSATPIYNSDVFKLYCEDKNGLIDDAFDAAINEGIVTEVKSIMEAIRLGIYFALDQALSSAAYEWEREQDNEGEN